MANLFTISVLTEEVFISANIVFLVAVTEEKQGEKSKGR